MSDNLKDAKECGAKIEEPLPTMHWITFCDDELDAYTARRLASQQAAHDAEIAKLKEENELYRAEMSGAKEAGWYSAEELFSAYKTTDAKLSTANERIAYLEGLVAAKDDALKDAFDFPSDFFDRDNNEIVQIAVLGRHLKSVKAAIAFTPQQVSEWERKQLEPLRAQVAEQAKCINLFFNCFDILTDGPDASDEAQALGFLQEARELRKKLLHNTQATAEQLIAECEQRGAVKALEAARNTASLIRRRYGGTGAKYAEEMLTDLLVELRATSKKAG